MRRNSSSKIVGIAAAVMMIASFAAGQADAEEQRMAALSSDNDLATCGPIRVTWKIPAYRADGKYDLTFHQERGGLVAEISNFSSTSPTPSPNGAVKDLIVKGNMVSFASKTGATYEIAMAGCSVASGTGTVNHPQVGLLSLEISG